MPISRSFRQRGATLAITAALAAFAGAAFYLPGLDTGFASEDFLVLAHLSNESLLDTVRSEVSSPWLGLVPVGFWRPVSTLLLALELRLFGLHPARFHAAHLAVHALDAWLVAMIVVLLVGPRRRADDPRDGHPPDADGARRIAVAVSAGALFAVHPFHPSAVLFIGAFATLFSATFSLLSIYCFVAARCCDVSRERSRRRLDLAAIFFFALALGSYEAAVVVPVVLLVTTLLLPGPIVARGDSARGARTGAAARSLGPFFVLVALYLSARLVILETPVGGYAALRARFFSAPLERARDLAAALGRIFHPHFELGAVSWWVWWIWTGAVVGALVIAADRRRACRSALAGLAWIALSLAPFAFVGLVPANGRYAYFAIAGVALAIAGLAGQIATRRPLLGAMVIAGASIAVAAGWLGPLRHTVATYDRARALVATVRSEVLRVAAEHAGAGTLVLVDSPPDFVKGTAGEPIAKVFQYGLAEAVRPPFGPLLRAPVPLPASLGAPSRAALAALPGTASYRWDPTAGRLLPVAAEAAPVVTLVLGPYDPVAGRLTASCGDCAGPRLVILTTALPFVITPERIAGGHAIYAVSSDFLRGLDGLGDGPAFFWIEQRGDSGAVARSAIARFEVGAGAARSFAEAAANMRRDSGERDEPGLERFP